jgi:hypothetical protein
MRHSTLRKAAEAVVHHNIGQTSTYLAASGGGDADAMKLFERRVGRSVLLVSNDTSQSGTLNNDASNGENADAAPAAVD